MENNPLDIDISEKCTFCTESFVNLSEFVEHLARNCKAKKGLEEKNKPPNPEQRLTIVCKDDWCKHSNRELNRLLEIIKGTKGGKRSVAGDTRSYSSGMMNGGIKGATPESLELRSRNGGEGDEDSSGSGSSIINSRAFGHHRRFMSRQECWPIGDYYSVVCCLPIFPLCRKWLILSIYPSRRGFHPSRRARSSTKTPPRRCNYLLEHFRPHQIRSTSRDF